MLSRVILLLISVAAFLPLHAQQKHELTVQQAVDLAMKNVIELKNVQVDYEIQKSKNQEIFGQALPQVTANAGLQHYLQLPQILFPDGSATAIYSILKNEGVLPNAVIPQPELRSVSFQQPWNSTMGATLTQLLFQPDVFVGLQARKTALQFAGSNIEVTKQKIKDSAYRRYYAILITQKQRDFLGESIKRLEKLFSDQQAMQKAGFVDQLSLDQTEVQLTNLKTSYNVVNNVVGLAYAALKFSIGIPQKDSVVLVEELSPDKIKDAVLDEGFKYEDRPEMKTVQYARDLQKLNLKRHKLGFIPTIAAQANYTVNSLGEKFITDKSTSWIRSSYIGFNMSVPIFSGFQRRERVRQAEFELQKVDNNIEQLKQVIDLQQVASKESLKNALLNLDVQQRNIQLAQKVYNTTKIAFENGVSSNRDLLLAEDALQRAQSSYFDALYNAIISKISYQSSLGKLQ